MTRKTDDPNTATRGVRWHPVRKALLVLALVTLGGIIQAGESVIPHDAVLSAKVDAIATAHPVHSTYVLDEDSSPKDSEKEWTWLLGAGSRWDPTGQRNGHNAGTLTYKYIDAGNDDTSMRETIFPKVFKRLAPLTGFKYREVDDADRADVKIGWGKLEDPSWAGQAKITRWDYTRFGTQRLVGAEITLGHNLKDFSEDFMVALVAHEWGHVHGLGHVDGHQLMNHDIVTNGKFGAGDLAGFRAVSAHMGRVH